MAVDNISITINQNSQSIANNNTSITVVGKCRTTGPSFDYNDRTGTVTIDGKNYSFTSDFPESSNITIFSKTVTVNHNSNGTKTVSASFKVTTGMTGSLDGGVISASTSKTLTTIPRTSKVSLSNTNFNIGTKVTIKTNRASSSFTHIATITYNGQTVRTQKSIGASYSWDTKELYQYVPNKNSATGKVVLTTYSGSTQTSANKIGESSINFTANVTDSNPTFSNFEVVDSNSKTVALTGDNNKFIKKYSNATVTISTANKMVAKNNATASKYSIVAGSVTKEKTYSDTASVFETINNINANTISVFAIDSRNNQTSVTKSLSIINYTECLLQSLNIERIDGIGTNVQISIVGTYSTVNFGAITNTLKTAQLRYKLRTSNTWSDWTNILNLLTISNGRFSCLDKIVSGITFELGKEYDIQVQVTDELSTDTESIILNSGIVLMSAVKDEGVCFGGIYNSEIGDTLQAQGELETLPVSKLLTLFKCYPITTANLDLNDFTDTGFYYFAEPYKPTNIPIGVNGWLQVIKAGNYSDLVKQIWYRHGTPNVNDKDTFVRSCIGGTWSNWSAVVHYNVGDVIVTSTNTNPSGRFGGTWQLIDKEFASWATNSTSGMFTHNTANVSSSSIVILRQGHLVTIRLQFNNKVAMGDNVTEIGTFTKEAFGSNNDDIYYSRYFIGLSDGGNGVLQTTLTSGRVLRVDDVVTKTSGGNIAAGSGCSVTLDWQMPMSRMLDSACDKFYWKRTA